MLFSRSQSRAAKLWRCENEIRLANTFSRVLLDALENARAVLFTRDRIRLDSLKKSIHFTGRPITSQRLWRYTIVTC